MSHESGYLTFALWRGWVVTCRYGLYLPLAANLIFFTKAAGRRPLGRLKYETEGMRPTLP
ncbi:hypothetical protein Aam_172_002 [Acidocella aminolytica 101 = DSM 11237]|uniref:Uncharacterized protein n=1 Tax=Acidocella aminolytica 101 = DSM 11237 TaxID=1120923 RepID=A0A0D6PKJ4_9PROT|nr:hypothetical protein Aam_172_002 [Acidocella aminolytica 101 = DSM 11237]